MRSPPAPPERPGTPSRTCRRARCPSPDAGSSRTSPRLPLSVVSDRGCDSTLRSRNPSSTALQRGSGAYTIGNVDALPEIERTVSELGAKVARARSERGWSLAQLAERSGLSAATVHKIEKSGMTPTIASLMKVAAALGKSVGHFVEEADSGRPATVVRHGERAPVFTSKQGLVLENVSGRYGP